MGDRERERFKENVVEVLLYFASEGGGKRLPSIDNFLTSEVVAATIEYLTGKEYPDTYCKTGRRFKQDWTYWFRLTNNSVAEILNKFGNKINFALKEAIKEAVEFHFLYDHGDKWAENLFRWFPHRPKMESTYSLSVEDAKKIREQIIPSLDSDTVDRCLEIAEIMKKYIAEDLGFIKNHYRW